MPGAQTKSQIAANATLITFKRLNLKAVIHSKLSTHVRLALRMKQLLIISVKAVNKVNISKKKVKVAKYVLARYVNLIINVYHVDIL